MRHIVEYNKFSSATKYVNPLVLFKKFQNELLLTKFYKLRNFATEFDGTLNTVSNVNLLLLIDNINLFQKYNWSH